AARAQEPGRKFRIAFVYPYPRGHPYVATILDELQCAGQVDYRYTRASTNCQSKCLCATAMYGQTRGGTHGTRIGVATTKTSIPLVLAGRCCLHTCGSANAHECRNG